MTMLTKPSRLDRDVAKWAARVAKAAKRNAEVRAAKAAWLKRSKECETRDHGICQFCMEPTANTGNPERIGSAHHIVYRSAGGTDDLWNLLWMHAMCHDLEHKHIISIIGTADHYTITKLRDR